MSPPVLVLRGRDTAIRQSLDAWRRDAAVSFPDRVIAMTQTEGGSRSPPEDRTGRAGVEWIDGASDRWVDTWRHLSERTQGHEGDLVLVQLTDQPLDIAGALAALMSMPDGHAGFRTSDVSLWGVVLATQTAQLSSGRQLQPDVDAKHLRRSAAALDDNDPHWGWMTFPSCTQGVRVPHQVCGLMATALADHAGDATDDEMHAWLWATVVSQGIPVTPELVAGDQAPPVAAITASDLAWDSEVYPWVSSALAHDLLSRPVNIAGRIAMDTLGVPTVIEEWRMACGANVVELFSAFMMRPADQPTGPNTTPAQHLSDIVLFGASRLAAAPLRLAAAACPAGSPQRERLARPWAGRSCAKHLMNIRARQIRRPTPTAPTRTRARPYVVSLTSVPSRYGMLDAIAMALCDLDPAPAGVFIWLDERMRHEPLPAGIRTLSSHGVVVRYVPDVGPHTKWYSVTGDPALRDMDVLVVDDDVLYEPQDLAPLLSGEPDEMRFASGNWVPWALHLACAERGVTLSPDQRPSRPHWLQYASSSFGPDRTGLPWPWLIRQTHNHGVMYPMSFLRDRAVCDIEAIRRVAPLHDDGWMWGARLATGANSTWLGCNQDRMLSLEEHSLERLPALGTAHRIRSQQSLHASASAVAPQERQKLRTIPGFDQVQREDALQSWTDTVVSGGLRDDMLGHLYQLQELAVIKHFGLARTLSQLFAESSVPLSAETVSLLDTAV